MKFTFEDQIYSLRFEHEMDMREDGDGRFAVAPMLTHAYIDCELTKGVKQPILAGLSRCAPGDTFCKETGRKIALTRALAGKDKAFRTSAWAAYHARKQKPEGKTLSQAN